MLKLGLNSFEATPESQTQSGDRKYTDTDAHVCVPLNCIE